MNIQYITTTLPLSPSPPPTFTFPYPPPHPVLEYDLLYNHIKILPLDSPKSCLKIVNVIFINIGCFLSYLLVLKNLEMID